MAQLDEAQADLLLVLCEAARRQPKGAKESFSAANGYGGASVQHPQLADGDHTAFHWPDLEVLRRYGLIHGRLGRGEMMFDVSPEGFEHFEILMKARGVPAARVEETVRRLLDSSAFAASFGGSYAIWSKAEDLYWSDRSSEHASTIGHLCREAMQTFGVAFAEACGAKATKAEKTIENVRSGLAELKGQASARRLALLDALLSYWCAVIPMVQRQEHGASKEGDALTVEDSRMVVFQTAVVMFELANAVPQT